MKRTISILVLIAMMMASVLAILPAGAEEASEGGAATATRENVLYSSPNAADTHFAGEGNSFYYDYHYYVDKVNTFPMTNKGPSLRHGVNSGSGSASITDGVKFDGNMNHQFNSTGATITLADGTEATHSHIFGLSFKNSITVDGFKLWAAAGVDGYQDVARITVYGATVDPSKAVDAPDYKSGYFYYGAPTLLYAMEETDNLQAYIEQEDGKQAAVIGADFATVTIDYLLIGVDFEGEVASGKYRVYEVEAYKAALVKDPATAVLGDVLYSFNFNGDEAFQPAELAASTGNMDYTVSADGRSVTVKGKEGGAEKSVNHWGGEVAGLAAALTDVYSLRYKVKAHSEGVTVADTAKNNSVGVGGWATDLTAGQPKYYNNYGNHNTAAGDNVSMRRSAISNGDTKYNGNYVKWDTFEAPIKEDADGFVDMLLVFDGPNGKIISYVLNQSGAWMLIEEQDKLTEAGNMGFFVYSYYNVVNTTVKDAKIYKGDFTTYIPPAVEQATEEELASLKFYIDQADALTEANYTASSWSKLARALERAKEIYNSDTKPKADVESRTIALMNTLNKLEADMTAINTLISESRKLAKADYTEDSWATFEEALTAAKANESVAYDVVKPLYDALAAAREGLVVVPADKTELEDLLARADVLKAEDFAEDAWEAFESKVEAAKAVFEAEGVTNSEVADAAKALKRAIMSINGGVLPDLPEAEEPTEKPTEVPTEKPTEKPTEAATAAPTEPATEPAKSGCGGIIGASAVAVAVLLGAVALKKKED